MKLPSQELLLSLVLVLLGTSCAGGEQKPVLSGKLVHPGQRQNEYFIDLAKPNIVKKGPNCQLLIYYIAKGTRSEGLHGILIQNGSVVDIPQNSQEMKTELGALVSGGPWEKRMMLFSKSGWLPKDLAGIYPSWENKK